MTAIAELGSGGGDGGAFCDAVSVVIPTRDRRDLVQRAIDSVLAQSAPPLEVLVVDDGSTDGTAQALVERYGGRPNTTPVEVLRSDESRGVSAARNRGVAVARGSWIALLDSDDWWRPEKLAAQLAALEEFPGHRICHCGETWIRRGNQVLQRRIHAKRGGDLFEDSLARCVISPSAVLLQRSLLDELGGFDEALPACEDYDLWLRLTARHPVLFVDEPLVVKTGGHEDQLSRRFEAMDRFRLAALAKLLDGEGLTDDQRSAARTILAAKLEVLVSGAKRRGNHERAERWLRRWGACAETTAQVDEGCGDPLEMRSDTA